MSFKDISYLELWWPFVQWSGTICAIFGGYNENQFCEIILNLGQWFTMIQYIKLESIVHFNRFTETQLLWQLFCSVEGNHLYNFGRRHHEEQFCEIILKLDQWFRRKCCLKIFLI